MQQRLIKLPHPGDYGDIPKEHGTKHLSPSAFSVGHYNQGDYFSNEVQVLLFMPAHPWKLLVSSSAFLSYLLTMVWELFWFLIFFCKHIVGKPCANHPL